jgi:hypothetical protein
MLQGPKNNFRPYSISNSFTTLLVLFNDTQGKEEGIHEFRSWFEGHLGALSRLSVAIPLILQGMFFLRTMHARYADLLTQFVSKLNSLTPKSVPAGTKNSCWEGFLLAEHKHTNIPTMMEPFAPPAAWFCWSSIPHPREPLRKGLALATVEGI